MGYTVVISRRATKDLSKIKHSNLQEKVKELFLLLKENPFQIPPSFEKFVGDLNGKYSRRINVQHRLVYSVDKEKKLVKIYSAWSHYE